jgi:hypothetical protein
MSRYAGNGVRAILTVILGLFSLVSLIFGLYLLAC